MSGWKRLTTPLVPQVHRGVTRPRCDSPYPSEHRTLGDSGPTGWVSVSDEDPCDPVTSESFGHDLGPHPGRTGGEDTGSLGDDGRRVSGVRGPTGSSQGKDILCGATDIDRKVCCPP